MSLNDDISKCIIKVKELLNHVTIRTTIDFYIDPRLLASWCCKNNVTIEPSVYNNNTDWELAIESMEKYKDFEF